MPPDAINAFITRWENSGAAERANSVLEAYGWGDLRSHNTLVVNKEAPHSCGAGECVADAPREALSPSGPLSPSRQECRDSLLPPARREEFEKALFTRFVALIHKLITTGDRNVAAPYDVESLSAHFDRKNKKRTEQVEGILEALKELRQL